MVGRTEGGGGEGSNATKCDEGGVCHDRVKVGGRTDNKNREE